MTNRRRSATTRSVPAQTPEQLLEQAQEHIRPLIGVIDRLNEADAEDELRVINKQLKRRSAQSPRHPHHIAAGRTSDRGQPAPARGVESIKSTTFREEPLARL